MKRPILNKSTSHRLRLTHLIFLSFAFQLQNVDDHVHHHNDGGGCAFETKTKKTVFKSAESSSPLSQERKKQSQMLAELCVWNISSNLEQARATNEGDVCGDTRRIEQRRGWEMSVGVDTKPSQWKRWHSTTHKTMKTFYISVPILQATTLFHE